MIKLIASDMDGTLLNEKMQISAENIKAIKYAQKKGVEFLIATGRSKLESAKLLANAGIKVGYINLNGAMLYNTEGHLVFEQDIPTEKKQRNHKDFK
ncbi:hydrolase, haloacid dehalogenase-like family protein [Lactobacillus iners LactinV 01V1-a]|uniref:Hydrolase, haloacid dehalogenase-like family protein n=1 Tax=Lactobacillus iners LactinV 01V1-a TaxID=879297 RepID=E1NTP9_9LACO|nr:hydrolase, haloacid dehalogenase-like family protein [Lactobacillus iners LactinV 01V1-a]